MTGRVRVTAPGSVFFGKTGEALGSSDGGGVPRYDVRLEDAGGALPPMCFLAHEVEMLGGAEAPALRVGCARCGRDIGTTAEVEDLGGDEYAHAAGCPTGCPR